MIRLLYILLLIPYLGMSQDLNNPQIESIVYTNPASDKMGMLNHIIGQNNDTDAKLDQLLDLFFQSIEADHQLNMKLPSKLMELYIYNAYIGEFAGISMDSLAVYNIIVSDTCTGEGLSNEFNIVVDYDSDWVNLNMVEWEITELYIADDALETYSDAPYYIRKCIFKNALGMIHRGVARKNHLLYDPR